MEGIIIRGIGGFYYIYSDENGQVYECRARGIFRKDNQKPLPGDRVRFSVINEQELTGNLDEILPRHNALIRPAVANVDQALVIFACKDPDPNLNLLNRFLVMMEQIPLPVIICFNKADLDTDGQIRTRLEAAFAHTPYPLLFVSAARQEGLKDLEVLLAGKTTTVAGPSGAGKSSIVNLLQNHLEMATGELSEKIGRGKHTTRHTELLPIDKDTFILDTPGFSSVALQQDVTKETLEEFFPEIYELRDRCRFRGCAHMHEPDCAVQQAVHAGGISKDRYENYRLFYEELAQRRKY